jgi:hypothetical protein
MKQINEDVGLWKKAFSSILVCIGGFLYCAAALSAFARIFIGNNIDVGVTLILVILGTGLLYGGSALWLRWRMAFGIFLTVTGMFFLVYLVMPLPNQSAGFIAFKNASVLVGLLSFVSGIWFIIYQHRKDRTAQLVRAAENA